MKSSLYTPLFSLTVAALLAACSATSSDKDKKTVLEDLKKQHVELNAQIAKLEAEIAKEAGEAPVAIKAKEVSVQEITVGKFDHYVQTQGAVEAENSISVSAKSMGVITAVYVNEGQTVSKGQVLAQIDNSVFVQNISSLKSQLELAQTVFERQEKLWKQNIGTEVQYLQAKTNKEAAEKQLASLEEQNRMTRITAPVSGTVDNVAVKVGENISPGMPAVNIVNTSELKLVANVSEAYVTAIKKGNKVVVTIPELKKDIQSEVTFVGKTINQLSRTFVVEMKLSQNPDLRPNMTGVIKVIFHTEKEALTVPVNVVQDLNGEKIVYTAEQDGKNTVARKHVVTVDGVYDSRAQVKGLKPGDKIITVGYQGLSDGQFIKL